MLQCCAREIKAQHPMYEPSLTARRELLTGLTPVQVTLPAITQKLAWV